MDQPVDQKKIEDHFTKIEEALVGLKTQLFSSKKDLEIEIELSDLEIELQRKNEVIDYLHFLIKFKSH